MSNENLTIPIPLPDGTMASVTMPRHMTPESWKVFTDLMEIVVRQFMVPITQPRRSNMQYRSKETVEARQFTGEMFGPINFGVPKDTDEPHLLDGKFWIPSEEGEPTVVSIGDWIVWRRDNPPVAMHDITFRDLYADA